MTVAEPQVQEADPKPLAAPETPAEGKPEEARYKHPLLWVPTSYFAMGTVYVTVTTASTIMFKNLGMSTSESAFYSSWMGFAYTVKFLWAPLLEMFRTKKFFVVTCQLALAAFLLGIAFLLPLPQKTWVVPVVSMLFLAGFVGATMDIATDGVYVTTLPPKRQAQFTGVQSMSWSIGPVVATGLVIYLVGKLHETMSFRMAWLLVLAGMAALLAAVAVNHLAFLPVGAKSKDAPESFGAAMQTFGKAWLSFVKKPAILWMIAFAFLYRFGLGLLDKIGPLFLIDSRAAGGMGLDNSWLGLINGTVGTISFIVASILGGLFVARRGLRHVLLVLVLCLNLPNLTFLYLGFAQPDITTANGLWVVTACVAIEKFGWGFGAVGHMLYMMQQIAPGPYKTAHYAFATALLGFCMMVTGIISAGVQPATGYEAFFVFVLVGAAPSILVTLTAPFIHSEDSNVSQEGELAGSVEKKYVLPYGPRMAAIGVVGVLALVGAGVAYMQTTQFQSLRTQLSASPDACNQGNKRACYFQCDNKDKAACAQLAKLYAADAVSADTEESYGYNRRETWKWYEESLKLRCGEEGSSSSDAAACAELGASYVDPERWEDVLSPDTDIAAGFIKRACVASQAAKPAGDDAASVAVVRACDIESCINGDQAKCKDLCSSGYAGGCRQLSSLLAKESDAVGSNENLMKALTMRCENEKAPDVTACHKLAELKLEPQSFWAKALFQPAPPPTAEAKVYYQKACALGRKPDCAHR